jgi:endonuclease YncB( thermonuclease family)
VAFVIRCVAVAVVGVLSVGCGGGSAATLDGSVLQVLDGDSFVMTNAGERVEVRIGEIDAPEGGQPHGDRSRRELAALLDGSGVRLQIQTIDDYGRTVGRPYVGELDVAAELVRSGHAWAYRRYLRDPALLQLEQEARSANRGLWSLPEAERQPPWEWRRQARRQQPEHEEDCRIKGNINDRGERIYHRPGQMHYEETRISVSRGERWFCSEESARAAGWRPARR